MVLPLLTTMPGIEAECSGYEFAALARVDRLGALPPDPRSDFAKKNGAWGWRCVDWVDLKQADAGRWSPEGQDYG